MSPIMASTGCLDLVGADGIGALVFPTGALACASAYLFYLILFMLLKFFQILEGIIFPCN